MRIWISQYNDVAQRIMTTKGDIVKFDAIYEMLLKTMNYAWTFQADLCRWKMVERLRTMYPQFSTKNEKEVCER